MYCTQCGFKIEDGFKFCPECGVKVVSADSDGAEHRAKPMPPKGGYSYNPAGASNNSKMLSQADIDRIADEIFWRQPLLCGRKQVKELAKNCGISYADADAMLTERGKAYRKNKKLGKYPDTQYCPYCGSQDIEYFHKPGMIISRQSSAFKSIVISSQTDGVDMLQCQRCGVKWIPKKKK